jgi:hypothetical protein
MPIADCWDFNYSAKVLSHIDGVLSYDTGSGRQAAVGEYVYGATSGAVGKVLAVTGNTTSGTLTLTNVVGLFEDNELLEVASELGFDGLTDLAPELQGASIGDTVSGQTSGSTFGPIIAIEYNDSQQTGGAGAGAGTFYASAMSAAFTNDELLDNDTTGQTDIGDADGVGVDNDTALGTTQVAGDGIDVPGTANTNDSVIISYDAGTQLIPEQAVVNDGTTGATALVEQQYGPADGSVGSLRLVDYDSTGGVYTDNNSLVIQQVVNYDAQVAGQVFSVGNIVVGATSGATGRVLAVIDDGDSTGRIILADESGTWDAVTPDNIEVGGVKVAEVENTTFTLTAATINIPNGIRVEQRSASVAGGVAQGGIYASAGVSPANSLNIVRKFNSLYTLSQDTFDELAQMDDDEALDATGKNQAYQIVFDWWIPDLSFRFVRSGGVVDTNSQNVWANAQSVGTQNKITSTAFEYSSAQPYRQPQLYIEQNQQKIAPHWLEGQIDVMVKVRTWNDTRFINPATPALGQLLPGGDPAVDGAYTVFNREYHVSTFDATQFNAASGGVNTVALGTSDETVNNPNGTHTMDYTGGSAAALIIGEEFTAGSGNSLKVGIVVTDSGGTGATGTLEYVLKSGTNFVNTDSCTGTISGKTFTAPNPTNVVAGYGTDIAWPVVDIAADSTSSTIAGTFIPGESVTQAVTGATGRVCLANTTTDILYLEITTGTFSGLNVITGDSSTATWTPTGSATYNSAVTFDADLNNGDGAQPYAGAASGDRQGLGAESIQNVFQYGKYLSRHEEITYTFNGPGTADDGTVGRFFRRLKDAYAEVKPGAPIGTYTGSLAFAQGWFLDTGYIAAGDIRSFSVIDDNGVTRNPPNLQSLTITNVANGWRVAAYRSTGAGLTTILRDEFRVGPVGTNNQAADSIVEAQTGGTRSVSPLPADVPDSAVLRVQSPNDTGNYIRMTYSSVNRTNDEWTLTGTIGSFLTAAGESSADLTQNDLLHVVFIEEQATGASVTNTIQYVADIPIVYIEWCKSRCGTDARCHC